MTDEQFNYPFYLVTQKAEEIIQTGAAVFQKFTCGGCGNRLTMEVPNVFYKEGTCDKCDFVTNIELQGCNYLIVIGR